MPTKLVNGVGLYYEFHGPENGPLLVLNNGILMSTASWAYQTQAIARHYRLLLYDCRGQGQSDHPEGPYSMELHAQDLNALLESLEIGRAHIGGISYGGEVALEFTLSHPQKVLSLFLADTVSELGPELKIIAEGWINALQNGDPDFFFNVTVPWNFSPGFVAKNPLLIEDARRRYALLDFPAVQRLCESFLQVHTTDRLNQIQAQTCIVVGELDLLKGPRYAEILHRGLPHSELHILKDSGHVTCWEAAQAFNSVLLGFLAKMSE